MKQGAAGAAKRAMEIVTPKVDAIGRAVALEAHRRIVMRTPVDQGTARANWNTSVDGEDATVDLSLTSADVVGTLSEGKRTIDGISFAEGHTAVITNALPYIGGLEDGTSTQAPNGMVAVTVEELRPLAEQIARKEGDRG